MYSIKEAYFTIQGEGFHTGRPAVFLRFAGCNLWSGREEDRATAVCKFCDTDFFGVDGPDGGKFKSADDLAEHVASLWPAKKQSPFVVCTGGEPALQLDDQLVDALKARGFFIAIETNGTLPLVDGIDWVCVSPKADAAVEIRSGNELKVVVPQEGQSLKGMSDWDFDHFFVQPLDDERLENNTRYAVDFCLANPQWRLSLQTHKLLGIP